MSVSPDMSGAPQLPLDLLAPEPPSFDNFLPGDNAELLARLRDAVQDTGHASLFLWGIAGAGKTHLLHAAVATARARGRPARLLSPQLPEWCAGEDDLVAVDDVQGASPAQQGALFSLCNDLRARGGTLLAAGAQPLAGLALRDDVRTRLGWGLVYEVKPLRDEAKAQALVAYAQRRGFRLSEDVLQYLLTRARRDLPTLLATLSALDRYSLATKRPVTVPLVRDLLQSTLL
jgi:DnaA family protein